MPDSRAFDVLIVGAGPAGIAAACAASKGAGRVGVVDGNPSPGGQIWRRDFAHQASPQTAHWLERFRNSRAGLFAATQVIDRPSPGHVLCDSPSGSIELSFSKLIIASGARERFLPFPGWTLPNVMGAGGLQALVKGGMPIAGRRVIVAGSGPLLLAVAEYLRKRGAIIPLIAEQADRSRVARFGLSLFRQPRKLAQAARFRIGGPRYLTGCWPIRAEGAEKLEAVMLQRGGKTWREPCEHLACGFGLVPNLELASLSGCRIEDGYVAVDNWQETSVENIYCAGEPAGIGGLDLALVTGEIAGYASAGLKDKAARLFDRRGREQKFRKELEHAFRLREDLKLLPAAETVICRCDDVPYSRLREHHSWQAAKLQTRCGMGPCQGRICSPATEFLLGWPHGSVRPPLLPAAVERLL